jgi:uncharacterized protein YecE (DUF72 family)
MIWMRSLFSITRGPDSFENAFAHTRFAFLQREPFRAVVTPRASQKNSGRILIGTASWTDPGFVERWYPKKMAAHERLAWYAQHFEMVEVNSTFYSVPAEKMVERWCASTPDDFVFDVKLHQFFSFHSTNRKLLPPELQRIVQSDAKGKVNRSQELQDALLKSFLRPMLILQSAGKLGVFLLQLSPAFSSRKHELEELEPLIEQLAGWPLAIEFRNRHWGAGDQLRSTIDFLRRYHVAFVNVDAPSADHFSILSSDLNEVTNPDFTYLRLHGRDAKAYLTGKTVAARFNYNYSDEEISDVSERSKKLAREVKAVHVVFNNNNLDYAPRAALRLRKVLGQSIAAPSPETPELF